MDRWIYRGKAHPFGIVGQVTRLAGPYYTDHHAEQAARVYERDGFAVLILTEEQAKQHNARTKKGL